MIKLSKEEKKEARTWREGRINSIWKKLKGGDEPTTEEIAFCDFWGESWILNLKWT